ncbi:hypothetical protein RvY_15755 [Ramazzottius varieornatus]|uniref:SCP2 domain-containing protein n=1 Tax=Ramazzottius varieornatus TaxID=947166 RepID=A0A1D1W0L5_RAMVA|nr:hypothetical protein RvY_15755 [Ramazzottius varieornatus]
MDGFIDEELDSAGSMLGQDSFSKIGSLTRTGARNPAASGDESEVARIFKEAERTLQQSSERKIQDVFVFDVDGDKWYLDGINSKIGPGEPISPPSCTMKMNTNDFIDLFVGSVTPTIAFMSGKVKIKGNMSLL